MARLSPPGPLVEGLEGKGSGAAVCHWFLETSPISQVINLTESNPRPPSASLPLRYIEKYNQEEAQGLVAAVALGYYTGQPLLYGRSAKGTKWP